MLKSLNEDFYSALEYRLTRVFRKSDQKEIRSLWCDGISPEIEPDENLIESKSIPAKAWIGKDGQEEYSMSILLGEHAIAKYSNGNSLIDTIPDLESEDWIDLDIDRKTISVQLY